MKNLISLILVVFSTVYYYGQDIVLTNVYQNENAYLIDYENINYNHSVGKVMMFDNFNVNDSIDYEVVLNKGGLIFKSLNWEQMENLIWNLKHPTQQVEDFYMLNVPKEERISFNKENKIEYCGLSLIDQSISSKKLVKEAIYNNYKISIYEVCVNGLSINVKRRKTDFFIDGMLDSDYINHKSKQANLFIPFSECINK